MSYFYSRVNQPNTTLVYTANGFALSEPHEISPTHLNYDHKIGDYWENVKTKVVYKCLDNAKNNAKWCDITMVDPQTQDPTTELEYIAQILPICIPIIIDYVNIATNIIKYEKRFNDHNRHITYISHSSQIRENQSDIVIEPGESGSLKKITLPILKYCQNKLFRFMQVCPLDKKFQLSNIVPFGNEQIIGANMNRLTLSNQWVAELLATKYGWVVVNYSKPKI